MPVVSNLVAPCDADVIAEAEALCARELRRQPDQPDLLHLLGLIARRSGRSTFAAACLAHAVALAPHDVKYNLDLADTLAATGRTQQALDVYTQATLLAPADHRPRLGAGRSLAQLHRWPEAEEALREAWLRAPMEGAILGALGDVHAARGDWRKALAHYSRWRDLTSEDGQPYALAGRACLALQTPAEAEEWFRRGLAVDARLAELHTGLGSALLRRGAFSDALQAFRAALTIDPLDLAACQWFIQAAELTSRADEVTSGWYRFGCALEARQRFSEAEVAFQRALQRRPDSIVTMLRLGDLELRLQKPADAWPLYTRAVVLRPESRLAHIGLGMAAHAIGDLSRGWREFTWYQQHDAEDARDFEQPLWDGAPLQGRTILLWADWALGDAIQFVRYAPLVQALGGRVVLECHPRLLPLFRRIDGVTRAVARGTALPAFDLHAPLFSLPRIFDTSLDTIPRTSPYLSVDDALKHEWTQRLTARPSQRVRDGRPPLTVGLVWAGEPDRPNARLRFTTLYAFGELAQVKGVRFISLQQGRSSLELLAPPSGLHVEVFEEEARSIADSAALIASIDLVITVDTMVAHLAGALGRPVWTLLAHGPDWRWRCEGTASPWYPTMRLFRQARPGDWEGVLQQACGALAALVERHHDAGAINTSAHV